LSAVPAPPSPWLLEWRRALEQAAREGPALDLACGRGRNARAAAGWGVPVVGLDRNAEFLAELRAAAGASDLPVTCVRADLETTHGIPVRAGSCGAILVFRFLFRPLAAAIQEALAPGGLLLYETFTTNQRMLGHGPRQEGFLLAPGELPSLFPRLRVQAHWEGICAAGAKPEAVARLAARRP